MYIKAWQCENYRDSFRFTRCNCWFKDGCSLWKWIAFFTLSWKLVVALSKPELRSLFIEATAQTHFLVNGSFYDQIGGVAMGSPLAPVLAIFLWGIMKFSRLWNFILPPICWWHFLFILLGTWCHYIFRLHCNCNCNCNLFTHVSRRNLELVIKCTCVRSN